MNKKIFLYKFLALLLLIILIVGIIHIPKFFPLSESKIKLFDNKPSTNGGAIPLSGKDGTKNHYQSINEGTTIFLPLINKGTIDHFLYGIFDSAGLVGGSVDFENYIKNAQAHGLDSALIINAIPDLSIPDRLNFKVIASPLYDLYRQWFYFESYHSGAALCGGNITIDCARKIIGPIVDAIKGHPSVKGYYIFDDATAQSKERIRLANQVFQEHDALNPASPGLLPGSNGQAVFEYTQPKAFIAYDYPARNAYPTCNFSEGGYQDWVSRLRETMQARPMSVPYWAILQAHGSTTGSLRTPTAEEMRLLNWLALGEDAKGIFWFTWSTDPDQFWKGIKDNPELLVEVTTLARRINPLKPYLSRIQKISDKFQISPSGNAYVSTLKDFSNGKLYVIAANHSCSSQNLALSSWFFKAKLKDLETGAVANLGTLLAFRGGDGKLFEVLDPVPLSPTPQPNLVKNPSFEIDADKNDIPDNWGAGGIRDTTVSHSGTASLKVTGPSSTVSSQVVTLKPDTKYYASWYMKGQNLTGSHLGFVYVQTNPKEAYLDFVMWDQSGSYDWVKRVGFFKTPGDYITGKINIGWKVTNGSTFWVDDLTLCEADLPCADSYLAEREK